MAGVGVVLAGIAQAHNEPAFIRFSNHDSRLSSESPYLTYYTHHTITFGRNATGISISFESVISGGISYSLTWLLAFTIIQ